jgi:hypothetical protein
VLGRANILRELEKGLVHRIVFKTRHEPKLTTRRCVHRLPQHATPALDESLKTPIDYERLDKTEVAAQPQKNSVHFSKQLQRSRRKRGSLSRGLGVLLPNKSRAFRRSGLLGHAATLAMHSGANKFASSDDHVASGKRAGSRTRRCKMRQGEFRILRFLTPTFGKCAFPRLEPPMAMLQFPTALIRAVR